MDENKKTENKNADEIMYRNDETAELNREPSPETPQTGDGVVKLPETAGEKPSGHGKRFKAAMIAACACAVAAAILAGFRRLRLA